MTSQSLTDALRETLACFDEGGAPWTTSEVASSLDLGRRSTYDRLNRLVEQDVLKTKKVGGNGRVWWRPQQDAEQSENHGEFTELVAAVEEYAIFTLDTEGHVQTWNSRAEQIKGYEAEDIIGEHFSTFYTAADREAGVPTGNLEDAANAGAVEDEGWRVRKNGSRFWANVTITAIRDDDGTLAGFAKVTRDMTDRREREEELRQQRDYTRQLLETAPVGVVTVEPDGTFTTANERAAELLELDGEQGEVGTRPVYDEDGEFVPSGERPYLNAFETGESIRDWHGQVELSNGSRRWLSYNVEPLTDDTGTIEELLVTIEDITRLKEQTRRLKRQRDDLEAELEDVFERVDDGFVALDEEFRFTYVNSHAAALLEHSGTELVDRYIWDVFEPDPEAKQALEDALETQNSVSFEQFYRPFDSWFEVNVYPSENGLSMYFQDITERKERERGLEQYETVAQSASDVIVTIDTDSVIRDINPACADIFGYDPDDLVGEPLSTVIPERLVDDHFAAMEQYLQTGTRNLDWDYVELPGVRSDGTEIPLAVSFSEYKHGGERYFAGILRDISERKERERELERALDLVHRTEGIADVGGWEVDPETMDVFWSENLFELLGLLSGEEPPVDEALEVYSEEDRPIVEQAIEDALEAGEPFDVEVRFRRSDDEMRWAHVQGVPQSEDGEVVSLRGAFQDITERKEREQALHEAKTQLEAATTAGEVGTWQWDVQEDEFVTDSWFARTFGVDPDAAREGTSIEAFTSRIHEEDRDRVNAEIESALSDCGDYETEFRVWDASGEIRWVVARGTVVCDDDGNPLSFPGALTDITDRKRTEQELERQREQLAVMNSLNETVLDITDAVVACSTRDEIEQVVCEQLATSQPYVFAWIGDIDVSSQSVKVQAQAQAQEYLDEVTITVDPDDEHGEGPTGRAFQTGEMQTTRDVLTDEQYESWREQAAEYGFRSSAAIPLVHEDTIYGVLNVYAERADAFEGQEQRIISQLGEIVAHAIAAADRKQALMSDEVVELDFLLTEVSQMFDIEGSVDGPLTFDRSVQIDDEAYLQYGTVEAGSVDSLRAIVEQIPHFEELTILGQEDDTVRFELRLSDPPVTSAVAAHGGHIQQAKVEDDEFHLTVHLPPSVSARKIIETIQEAYPPAELRSRRQLARDDESVEPASLSVTSDLTDRQQAVLEAATYAGFFEWPRESSGEEVAESLDIAPPTFSQHLRKGQEKVFTSLFQQPPS